MLPGGNKVMAVLVGEFISKIAVDERRPSIALRREAVKLDEVHHS